MRFLAALPLLAALAAASPAGELAALQKKFDTARMGRAQKYEHFKPLYEAFANKHAGTEEALTARLWLLQQSWWLYKDRGAMNAEAGRVADRILADYPLSKRLDHFVLYHYVFSGAQKEAYFQRLMVESPHREVKAAARFGLGRHFFRTDKAVAKRHLEALAKDFADVSYRTTTYGAMAHAYLNRHDRKKLALGQPAPEIRGVDHRGKALKLSDFRGKVVVLDFWGDW